MLSNGEWIVEKYTGYAKVKKDRVEKRNGYAKIAKPRSVWKSFSWVFQNCKHFAKIANPTLPKLQTLGKIGIHTEIYLKLLRVYTEIYLNLLRKRRQTQRAYTHECVRVFVGLSNTASCKKKTK